MKAAPNRPPLTRKKRTDVPTRFARRAIHKQLWFMTVLPFVSVIVPVRNEAKSITRLLSALDGQSYPRDRFEVLVVDNGSTDDTASLARAHGAVVLPASSTPNPDSARNVGLRAASGELVAFTDADCSPDTDWLRSIAHALTNTPTAVVGGQIRFSLEEPVAGAQVYDAMSFLNHQTSIPLRNLAFTANLALRKDHALSVGGIPVNAAGYGDAYFSRLCDRNGYKLSYVASAIVFHPPRKLRALLRKTKRIARVRGLVGNYDHFCSAVPKERRAGGVREVLAMPHVHALWPPNTLRFLQNNKLTTSPTLVVRTIAACLATLAVGAAITMWYSMVKVLLPSTRDQMLIGMPPRK